MRPLRGRSLWGRPLVPLRGEAPKPKGGPTTAGDSTPGGANDVLLLANATDGLLLADGSSFLILAGN